MNCNCITETTEKLKTRVLELDFTRPKKATGLNRVSCANLGITWKDGRTVLSIPFDIHWNGQKKIEIVNMIAEFCPFCGKPTAKEAK